jgi:hypothetical protein
MKRFTNLHKPALFVLLFSFLVGSSAQQTGKSKSDRWLKREAFKNLDHFYIGAHLGVAIPFAFYTREDINTGQTDIGSKYVFSLNFLTPPQHRLFVGYKWKRHYFEVSGESKMFMAYPVNPDPSSSFFYPTPRMGWYFSLGYNIDLMPQKSDFKISVGANSGVYIYYQSVSPVLGLSSTFELPCTKTFSLFVDLRYTIGFTTISSQTDYPSTRYYNRLMCLDFNFGFRFNIFSKRNAEKGMKQYQVLKTQQGL